MIQLAVDMETMDDGFPIAKTYSRLAPINMFIYSADKH